jgi:hypothetical protein
MLYQNPAIQSRVEVHLVEEAKGGPSKLLLSFLFNYHITRQTVHTQELVIVSHLYSLRPCDRYLISVSAVRYIYPGTCEIFLTVNNNDYSKKLSSLNSSVMDDNHDSYKTANVNFFERLIKY